MSESEYEAFEVSTSSEPIRVPPIVLCSTGCGRPILTGSPLCRECYEADMAKRFRESLANTKDKPITHY